MRGSRPLIWLGLALISAALGVFALSTDPTPSDSPAEASVTPTARAPENAAGSAKPTSSGAALRAPSDPRGAARRPAKAEAQRLTRVIGVVRDAAGNPVRNARVHCWEGRRRPIRKDGAFTIPPTSETATDMAGRFELMVDGPRFSLEAEAMLDGRPAFGLRRVAGDTRRRPLIDGLELVVDKTIVLRGRVVSEFGRPVPSIAVDTVKRYPFGNLATRGLVTERPIGSNAITDSAGRFSARVLANYAERWSVKPRSRPERTVEHRAIDGFLQITIPTGTRLAGLVLDAAGRPAANAKVEWVGDRISTTRTDANGRWELEGVGSTSRIDFLRIDHEGSAIYCDQPTRDPNAPLTQLTARLLPPHELSGRVVDVDGAGIPNAKVRISGPRTIDRGYVNEERPLTWEWTHRRDTARTDADGNFRFTRLYPGRFAVAAATAGNTPIARLDPPAPGTARADVESVASTPSTDLERFRLRITTEAIPKITIRGRVTDITTGKPITDFDITAMRVSDGSPQSGRIVDFRDRPDGRFELRNYPARDYQLRVAADGYVDFQDAIRNFDPSTPPIDLRLQPARDIRVRVSTADGRPAAGNVVILRRDGSTLWIPNRGGSSWLARIPIEGTTLRRMPPELVTIRVSRPETRTGFAESKVDFGQLGDRILQLTLPATDD